MLFVLLKTGMRGFELINLKMEDVSIEGDLFKIKIKGKGNKERINFLRKDEIGEYFERYFSKRDIDSEYLFPNKDGKPLSRFILYDFNTRFLAKLLIKKQDCIYTGILLQE